MAMEDKEFRYKNELVQEALKEFAEKGFDSASLNQIIKRSGISKGSFYHHFDNKETLFSSVVQRVADEKLAFINQWLQQQGNGIKTAGFFEILQLQMEGGVEFALQYPELNQFLMSILKNPELMAKAEELSPRYYDEVFDPLIKDAVERGELRSDLEPNFMKQLIKYSLMNMGEIMLENIGDELNKEELMEQSRQFLDFLQHGLKA